MAGLLDEIDVVATVEDALRMNAVGETVLPAEAYLRWDVDDGWARSLTLPAALGRPAYAAGIKVINGNVANPGRGVPRASGLILLFDVETAQVTTIMAAAQVSAMRTAAVSVAAVKRLAPRIVERALVVGAGPIGEAHARMLGRAVASLGTIWSYDADGTRAVELAGRVEGVVAVEDWRSVVGRADVVIAATTSTEAYLRLGDVAPGAIVVNVGLDDCAEDLLLGADHLVVDSWDLVADDRNRLLGRLIAAGAVLPPGVDAGTGGRQRVAGELGRILAGAVEIVPKPEQRVVVNPFGMAVNDIAVATAVDRLARRGTAGQRLTR
ncbi:ornithine cyclodeaminase family protein [Hamadaea tsunoensis]|uniref:ornithine cyclodeaminase family protein n=1 Tax=Hamadaea tsunoensis TaxID=53368 RepID=UPI0004102E77|nr:ornithine cyclodeaminase family protein [Hamadaea tsunoensis]